MIQFTEKQINILKGQFTAIARAEHVSPSYVRLVVMGRRQTNTEKAKAVAQKAKLILEIFEK